MLTGGTGFISSLIIERLLSTDTHWPHKIIAYSRSWDRSERLKREVSDPRLRCINGDVCDYEKLLSAMRDVDLVIHTAAYKSVPSAEYNPLEAVRVNVHGTENVITCAIKSGVERVTFISSDKATSPVNLYGATKLLGEMCVINANNLGAVHFNVCRYGNVLNSTGSVVPLFTKLIQDGHDELPVTDPKMTRFWFPPDDAVEFVLNIALDGERGTLNIPKLKASTIEALVQAMGIKYDMDAKTRLVGIRPGEKKHESMVSDLEAERAVDVGSHIVIKPFSHDWDKNWDIVGKPASPTWFHSNTTMRYTVEELASLI